MTFSCTAIVLSYPSSFLPLLHSLHLCTIILLCSALLCSILRSVPIFEGLPLRHAAVFADIGGRDITANLRARLAEHNFDISHFDCKILKEKHCFIGTRPLPLSLSLPLSMYQEKGGMRHGAAEEVSSFFLPDGEEVPLKKHCESSHTT